MKGQKNDKIDATKLVRLLKAGLTKKVYHSMDQFLILRRIVSGYEDLVKAGVRLKNQRYLLLRACEKKGQEKAGIGLINAVKIVSRVVTPHRFADKGHYLSYAGLIKLDKISGGRSYGKKDSTFCPAVKERV